MKKYTTLIICTILIFSSPMSIHAANNGYIGDLFQLETGPEVMRLTTGIEKIKKYNFKSIKLQNKWKNYKTADTLFIQEIIRLYEEGKLDYYSMHAVTTYYHYYRYHTNRMFYYESVKEIAPHYTQLNSVIHTHYEKSRNYYNKVQFIIRKAQKQNKKINLFEIYN